MATTIDPENPDLIGAFIEFDVDDLINDFYEKVKTCLEQSMMTMLQGESMPAWRVTGIEQRAEVRYEPRPTTGGNPFPDYHVHKHLATFSVELVENGPTAKKVNGEWVPIPRRRLHIEAEREYSGYIKITKCSVESPRRQ